MSAIARSTSNGVLRNDGSPSSTASPERRDLALVRHPDRACVHDAHVARAPLELVMRVPDHDDALLDPAEARLQRVVGREHGRDRRVVLRRRVAVENAVDRRAERPLRQPAQVVAAQPLAIPLPRLALGVAADEARAVQPAHAPDHELRERPDDQVAAEQHAVEPFARTSSSTASSACGMPWTS